MHIAMKPARNPAMISRVLLGAALMAGLAGLQAQAHAESAYIPQVSAKSAMAAPIAAVAPVQVAPASSYGPRQTSYVPIQTSMVPTPETAQAHGTNLANTLEIGKQNQVFQGQVGGTNYSNVGVIGGNNDHISVLQGGRDISNIQLVGISGLNLTILQPPGAPPINALIAKLPNGSYLIKR